MIVINNKKCSVCKATKTELLELPLFLIWKYKVCQGCVSVGFRLFKKDK